MNSSKLLPAQFLCREVFWYLGVHRYFHSTVHVSTALCTCWGTCWALDPDSCCTGPPFWAEPVAWTSTLCLDTRHGFITLGVHARVRARTVFDAWQRRPHAQARRWPVIRRWMTNGRCVSIIGCNDTKPPIGTHCRRWTLGFLESILVSYKWMTVLIGWLRPDLRRGRNDLAILSRDDYCVQIHDRHKCGEAWVCMRHLWNYSGLLCVVTIWFSFGCFFVWVSLWW